MLKTYLEWNFPGDTSLVEVKNRNNPTEIPKNAVGYRFMSRTEVMVDGEKLVGQYKDHSASTYFGEELTLAQVAQRPNTAVLQANMKSNNWERVVLTASGRYFPLDKNDIVVNLAWLNSSMSPN